MYARMHTIVFIIRSYHGANRKKKIGYKKTKYVAQQTKIKNI